MIEYGFLENQDFEVIVKKDENPQGGRPSADHAISLDMAKEICMIQRTEKGKEARRYFIECERRLKETTPTLSGDELILAAVTELKSRIANLAQTVVVQQAQIEADRPAVEFANQVGECTNGKGIREFGLVFKQNGAGFGQDGLVERLLRDKYIYRDQKGKLRPYAEYTNEDGLFWTKTVVIESAKGNFETVQVKVTGKGQQYFLNKYMPLSPEVGGDFPEGYFENAVA